MEPIWSELNLERVAGRSAAQLLVESDIPLPAGREAQNILHAQGQIKNEAVHCASGRVQAEGTLSLQMLCVDSEQTLFGVRASTQYAHDIQISGVSEGMHARVKPQLMDLRCTLRDYRVHMEAVAELNTVAECEDRMRVLSDVAGLGELQKQYTEMELGRWRTVGNSVLRMREELPASCAEQLLLADAAAQVQNVVLEGDGVFVKGVLFVNALYVGENKQLVHMTQQIPFEELVPVQLDTQTCRNVGVIPTVQEFTLVIGSMGDCLEMEACIHLEARCITQERLQALSDAYAPQGGCQCKQEEIERLSPTAFVTQVCTLHESIRVPDGMPDAYRTVFASARPTVLGVSDKDGQLAVDGLLVTCVIYQTDKGACIGFEEDVPFRCTLDAPYMPDAEVSVRMLEVRGSGSGRMLNVNFTLETQAVLNELIRVMLAVDAEPAEPVARENGIMVSFAAAGATFWTVGKEFGVTSEQLQTWNPTLTEPFEEGCPIVVLSASGRRKGAK